MLTKSRYSAMHKPQLVALLENLDAVRESLSQRFYLLDRQRCIALPLCDAERAAVDEFASMAASNDAGGGIPCGSDFDCVTGWRFEQLLPQFSGLLVRYSYTSENGTDVIGVWGLLPVSND